MWQSPSFLDETESKRAGVGGTGARRRMVEDLQNRIRVQRMNQSKEKGFTLDSNAVACGEASLRLPSYLPYFDPKQQLFLTSRERLIFVIRLIFHEPTP